MIYLGKWHNLIYHFSRTIRWHAWYPWDRIGTDTSSVDTHLGALSGSCWEAVVVSWEPGHGFRLSWVQTEFEGRTQRTCWWIEREIQGSQRCSRVSGLSNMMSRACMKCKGKVSRKIHGGRGGGSPIPRHMTILKAIPRTYLHSLGDDSISGVVSA